MISLGIDPGRHSGIALFNGQRIIYTRAVSVTDNVALAPVFVAFPELPTVVAIEAQHLAAEAGVQSILTLGAIRGRWFEAALSAYGITPTLVQPASWQCGVCGAGPTDLSKGRKKLAAMVALAHGAPPDATDDECDAACLAIYAWQTERMRGRGTRPGPRSTENGGRP